MGPAEAVELRHIAEFAWSSVGFGRIEGDSASEAHGFCHEFGKLLDGHLLASAHIDVTVADFAQRWNGAATAFAAVAVHLTIGIVAEMHRRVFVDADDVACLLYTSDAADDA